MLSVKDQRAHNPLVVGSNPTGPTKYPIEISRIGRAFKRTGSEAAHVTPVVQRLFAATLARGGRIPGKARFALIEALPAQRVVNRCLKLAI